MDRVGSLPKYETGGRRNPDGPVSSSTGVRFSEIGGTEPLDTSGRDPFRGMVDRGGGTKGREGEFPRGVTEVNQTSTTTSIFSVVDPEGL